MALTIGKVMFYGKAGSQIAHPGLGKYDVQDDRKFHSEGSFNDQPDQNMSGPTRKYIYFCEDGRKNRWVYERLVMMGRTLHCFKRFRGVFTTVMKRLELR